MKSNYKNIVLISFVLIFFSACAATEEKLDFTKPKMQIPKPTKVVEKKKGSLYTRKGPSLFADKKDLQIGDIIQVRIDESLTSDTNNKRELTRTDETNLGGGLLTPMAGNTLGGTVDKYANKFSVIIEETYQNGNYFIKGNKQLLIDGQRQELIITGVIRPYDITPENSVLSSQVANLKILYKKDGAEKDALQTPWGTKLLRKIWPF